MATKPFKWILQNTPRPHKPSPMKAEEKNKLKTKAMELKSVPPPQVKPALTLEEVTKEYIQREYPKSTEEVVLTDFDKRMIQTKFNLSQKYAAEMAKRKFVFAYEEKKPQILKQPPKTKSSPPPPPAPAPGCETCVPLSLKPTTCQAIKMSGEVCGAKLKPGNEFCGRHNKKK